MKPLAEIQLLLRSTTAQGLADRHPNQDVVLIEPYEKDRPYSASTPLHSGGKIMFLPKTVGKPVPVGRDARSLVLLDHPAVSRLHLVLAYTAEGWKVMDRSSNGSWMNEVRMTKEQAVPMTYGTPIRMGRALILRMFTLGDFHNYARSASGGGGAPAAPPAATDPQADTWRFPTAAPGPAQPAPPTVRQPPLPAAPPPRPVAPPRPAAPPPAPAFSVPSPPQAPAFPQAPSPPRPPAPPRKTVSDGDMEFDFDFDFESDNRGGFA